MDTRISGSMSLGGGVFFNPADQQHNFIAPISDSDRRQRDKVALEHRIFRSLGHRNKGSLGLWNSGILGLLDLKMRSLRKINFLKLREKSNTTTLVVYHEIQELEETNKIRDF